MLIGCDIRFTRLAAALVVFCVGCQPVLFAQNAARSAGPREIAITFDDLPKVVPPPARPEDPNQIYLSLTRLISVLHEHHAPAIGFVVGVNLDGPDQAARLSMLRLWVKSGMSLGNHSFTHPNLCEPNGRKFNDDVLRGEEELRKVGDLGSGNRYFRLPYLCTGRTALEKQAFQQFLKDRGVRNAPVTVEPGDYLFNELYVAARRKNDTALQKRIREEYLERIDTLLAYFEGVSRELFHREIRQVLLIHSNDLNADCLDEVFKTIEHRGYRFVTLDRALDDPAYSTPDDYVGPMGISWLHRWKIALAKPLEYRSEPRIAGWIVYELEKLHQAQP